MISRADIAHWKSGHPWQNNRQIEQDLLLSRAICAIAQDELLGNELVFRGGTALHKLFFDQPYRYSEDLDYVRRSAGGIGPIMRRITDIGLESGYNVNTKMGMYPKVLWKFAYEDGSTGRIKIELNTYERSSVYPLQYINFVVDSPYYQGAATVQTFQAEELIASKLRALYQRSKGRDLFDIWLALTQLELDPAKILAALPANLPEDVPAEKMIANLEEKLDSKGYCSDMNNLIRHGGAAYDPQTAGKLVIDTLLSKIEEA
ncbi:MAG: nucleotidyl transferase AbiEii/AbiGii toxin family protein [Eggerthellaceae bacterium]|nr:nucleotidyl transferase AbiEii/AbiGii toxin family protein [Eggerthellaceae bacterium]